MRKPIEILEECACATCGSKIADVMLESSTCEYCGAPLCNSCARACEREYLCAECEREGEEMAETYRDLDRWVNANK